MSPPVRAAAAHAVSYRPMTADDYGFTEALYRSTRWEELAQTGWSDAVKHAFLAQQHAAQHQHYQRHYSGAAWLIVERHGAAIGRLYLDQWDDEVRVIDISLLPAARGQGIGGAILQDVIDAAARNGRFVSIHVEKNNPARRLYARLGFVLTEDKGVYDLMTCRAALPD